MKQDLISKEFKNRVKHKRDHKKAKRPLVLSLFIILTVTLSWHFCRDGEVKPPSQRTLQGHTAIPSPPPAPVRHFINYIVKPGDTFGNILVSHGISDKNALQYYRHLLSMGLSALYPGDSLVFTLKPDSSLEKVSLLSRLQYWYHMTIEDLRIKAEKEPIATSTHLCIARGELLTSLSEAMYEIEIGDALAAQLTDIFAWDINFFIDPKKGDTFEVIFEKKYASGHFIGYGSILAAKYINNGKEFYALALPDEEGKINHYDCNGKSVQKQFLKAPLRYSRISSGYSYNRRHPILGIVRPHLGVDYAAPRGTPVYAPADGVVSFIGTKGGYGKHIRIRHGASYETYYGHLNSYARGIGRGTRIKQGQMIGTVGSTGLSTGPHLDYRMKLGSRFVNPLTISVPPKDGVTEESRPRFDALRHEYLSLMRFRCADTAGCFIISIIENDNSIDHKIKVFARNTSSSNDSKSNS
ncbi:MAG: peptidoglycan DD-metalloendopeptidase family protein [Chitinivibrionales bacterium]|nr:peptidoglycan DD-metalloendopeptidase family protein [Chitinivibrionales bacterium]